MRKWQTRAVQCPLYASANLLGNDRNGGANQLSAFNALFLYSKQMCPASVEPGLDEHFYVDTHIGMIVEIAVDGDLVDQINAGRIPPDTR